jgi:hypothetical protein
MDGGKQEKVILDADTKDLAKKRHVDNHNNMEKATLIIIALSYAMALLQET